MKNTVLSFTVFCIVIILVLFAVTSWKIKSVRQKAQTTQVLSNEAMGLAKTRFVSAGYDVSKYKASIMFVESTQQWCVYFAPISSFSAPGDDVLVAVDPIHKRTVLMHGQ